MVTEQTLAELRAMVLDRTTGEQRESLLEALDGLQRAIAAQSLVIRNMGAELRNRRIAQEAMDAIVPPAALQNLANRLGTPVQTPFSLAEAQAACAALANEATRAGDITAIAAAVARVVRVFV